MYMYSELLLFYENILHDVDIIISISTFGKLNKNAHEKAHKDFFAEANPMKQVNCCLDFIKISYIHATVTIYRTHYAAGGSRPSETT